MVIEEEKNVVKLRCKILSFFFNAVAFFIDIFAIKPRRWAFAVYLLFIFSPSVLQADSLAAWEVGNNGLNISSLIAIQLDKNLPWGATLMKPPNVNIKDRFGLNKWFSEAFRKAKEIVLFIPYFCEYVINDSEKGCKDKNDNCWNWNFWHYLLAVVVINFLFMVWYEAQQVIMQIRISFQKIMIAGNICYMDWYPGGEASP